MNGFQSAKIVARLLGFATMLGLTSPSAWADPLAETREVLFNGADLALKAAELKTPAAMYEYVRNTHEYALYHGSRSNTLNTYGGQRGSDVDIASVLIALYRSQKIPARYAVGDIRAPAADVANWLGVKNIDLAVAIMKDQGIQHVSLSADRQSIQFEHAWVQVQVPYDNYRGAIDNGVNCTATPTLCHWIDVDPSYKLRQFHNQGIDIYGIVKFDYNRYYDAIRNDDPRYRDKGPLEIYESQILEYLKANFPGKTLEDVADAGEIVPVGDGLLPASLPYEVRGAIKTYDAIADHDVDSTQKKWAKFARVRYNLGAFTFTGELVGPFILQSSSPPIALADLSTKKLTLSYFEGNGIAGDPFEHHQMVLRLDGKIVHTPILIAFQNNISSFIGRIFDITLELDGAPAINSSGSDSLISANYTNLVFGGYYLVGTGGDTSNWSQVHRAANQLLAANAQFKIINDASAPPVPYVDKNGNGIIDAGEPRLLDDPLAQDALTGGLLQVAMTQYYTRFVENTRRLGALNHVIAPVEGFIGVVSSNYDVDYLGSTAFSVMPGGLLIDMKGVRFNGFWRDNAAANYASDQFLLVGHEGSSLEHEIWQELTGFDAVSTVRGIQMARAVNTELLDLKKTAGVDTTAGMYTAFGFTNTAPASFTIAVRDVFSTRPTTWSNPTSTADKGFYLLKKFPLSGTDSRIGRLLYVNDFHHDNIGCFDSQEQAVRDLIATNGGTATLASSANLCGRTFPAGTTLNQVLSGLESEYINFFSIGSGGGFDYLDQLQGFNPAQFTFRDVQAPANIQPITLVQTIRNDVLFGSTNARWEYVIPTRKTNTGFNLFGVYIEKIFDKGDGSLGSLSFRISNDSFSAGGGWVDGTKTLEVANSIPGTSVIQPTFNNAVFTDKNLVSQTNNDLIRTPSTADPISTVTGNMYHDETDFTIKGRGLDYVFTRSYNSGPARADKDGPLGFGWTHAYNLSIRSNDYGACPNCAPGTGAGRAPENGNNVTASITYVDERGGEHTYLVDEATRAITPPPGEFDTVQPLQSGTPSAGQYAVIFRNGTRYVFDGPGNLFTVPGQTARLSYIEDPYNNRLTLRYDTNNRLIGVTDNLGVSGRGGLTFTYSGTGTHVQSVGDWSGRTWRFGYDSRGNLTSVTNPLNEIVSYTYHAGTHLLNERILPADRGGKKAKTTFTYYRNNKAFTNANAFGQGETLDYDLYRQRTRVTDPRGFVREHFYDKTNGALLQINEPDGGVLRFDNNTDGLRYRKTDGLGFETRYSYQANRAITAAGSDNFGRVSREIDPLNRFVDTDYGIFDQATNTRDKRGNPVTRVYYTTTTSDGVRGKLKEVRATLNGTPDVLLASYTYYTTGSAFGQLKRQIEFIDSSNPFRRRTTDYVYEPNGINLSTVTVSGALGGGGSTTTTFTYDGLGRVTRRSLERRTSATDATPLTLATAFTYDALDRVVRTTNPRGDFEETIYDGNGQVTQKKRSYLLGTTRAGCSEPGGFYVTCTELTHAYDAADRRISTQDILGGFGKTRFAYDANGNLTARTDANAHVTRYEYDAMNRRTAVIDANGHRSEMRYDLAGRLIATTDANGNTTRFKYDPLGRRTETISPLGRVTQTRYDANGNVTHRIDANATAGLQPKNAQGATVYREYDEFDRLTLERDALGGETRYTYDLLGDITSITDAEGQLTRFVYDDLGRLIETIDPIVEDPDKTDRVLLYDEAGNVLLTEDRSGRQVRHTYDKLDRRVLTEYLKDATQERFTYDAFGDLVQVANAEVTYTFTYTNRHRPASKTDSRQGRSLHWSYDLVGNLISKTDYQGEVTRYQYDGANRLIALANPAYLQVSYHYDGAGRLRNRILSNGAQTDYRYDADNRLIGLKNLSADRTPVADVSYQRDNLGNITRQSDTVSGKTTAYTYDALYRLREVDSSINAEDRAYTYDRVGNRTLANRNGSLYYYCYHPTDCSAPPRGNRLINIRIGSPTSPFVYRQFVYDEAGRLTQKQDGGGKRLYSLSYNGKGRVGAVVTTRFTFMGYDANDDRVRKNGELYYLEGENLEASYASDGTLVNKYLRGVVVDELVNGYRYRSGDANDWINYTFHHDALNSVTALSGHAGAIAERTEYDAFGAPLNLTLPGTGNDLLYTGRQYDRETGLYYYRARYYDPEVGRFISEDPLGFAAGDTNFYAYVGNNPINNNDPSGQFVCGGICIGIAVGVGTSLATGSAIRGGVEAVTNPNATTSSILSAAGEPTGLAIDTGLGLLGGGLASGARALQVSRLSSAAKGNLGEALIRNRLSASGTNFAEQIAVRTGQGTQFTKADFAFPLADGLGALEVKTFGSQLSANQLTLFNTIENGGAGLAFGKRATEAGFAGKSVTSIDQVRLGAFDFVRGSDGAIGGALFGGGFNAGSSAGGGFVLYPSKPNTNTLRSVYSK